MNSSLVLLDILRTAKGKILAVCVPVQPNNPHKSPAWTELVGICAVEVARRKIIDVHCELKNPQDLTPYHRRIIAETYLSELDRLGYEWL